MAGMSRATRGLIVACLIGRGMNPAEIASELGVSRETVRRDLHNPPPTGDVDEVADVAPGEEGLRLPVDAQLGQDLRLLAASYKAPPESVVRTLLSREAEAIRAKVRARGAAGREWPWPTPQ